MGRALAAHQRKLNIRPTRAAFLIKPLIAAIPREILRS